MEIVKADKKGIAEAAEVIKAGGSVAYPTDTSYGIAVDIYNDKAVRALYQLKGRDFKKPVLVAVSDRQQAQRLVVFNKTARKLWKRFFPGKLAIVLPLKTKKSSVLKLTANTGKLGIRQPDNKIVIKLIKAVGRPITSTSANVSGMPACYSIASMARQFKGRRRSLDLILDAGSLKKVRPSTIVGFDRARVTILRQGAVPADVVLGKETN